MKRDIKAGVAKELLFSFFMQIFLFSVFVIMISIVGYSILSKKIWYGDDPRYWVLHYIHNQWGFCFLLCLFLGCMLITCFHFLKIARIMQSVTDAVSDLSNQRVSYVSLPKQLHDVELEFNQIIQQMQHNRQIAREAEQRKNDMIVYMAHDLKTPLTSVIGYLNLLSDEKDISSGTREKYLGIALRKSERLEELLNEFFEMTKYNFSAQRLSLSKVNISMMLEQILCEFQLLFDQKRICCRTDIVPDLYLNCDVEKIERVFDNLFRNACNYCYSDSEIYVSLAAGKRDMAGRGSEAERIAVRESGAKDARAAEGQGPVSDGVVLTVRNFGRTIPKAQLEHLFEQFFRLDSSRSSETGGSGLGLAIAKEIVRQHGGEIGCESVDETITFTVYLPFLLSVDQNGMPNFAPDIISFKKY